MRYIGTLVILFLIGFSSCSKEANDLFAFDLAEGEIQMLYNETQCADPWYDTEVLDSTGSQDQKLSKLLDYLNQIGVNVLAAGYEFNEANALACLECHCQTGGVYLIKVYEDQNVIQTLKQLGFIQ